MSPDRLWHSTDDIQLLIHVVRQKVYKWFSPICIRFTIPNKNSYIVNPALRNGNMKQGSFG